MLNFFLITLIIIVLWTGVSKVLFSERICGKESMVKAGAATFVSAIFLVAMFSVGHYDTNILNGEVTGKQKVRVPCTHSYPCNCRTVCSGSGDSRSCSTVCDTCYRHTHDYDWVVRTTVGRLTIARIDSQGARTPPRWEAVEIGEPAARETSYRNWIKGAASSLYNFSQMELTSFADNIPAYPRVYDYYRVNRVVSAGAALPNASQLNTRLNENLRRLGPSKEVNIIVVTTNETSPLYRYALEQSWAGGRKNDVIVILGVDQEHNVVWSDTITIANNIGNEYMTVLMKDSIREIGNTLDAIRLADTISSVVQNHFTRKEMQDFEYLRKEYTPPTWAMLLYGLLIIGVLTALTIVFYRNNTFGTTFGNPRHTTKTNRRR